MPTAFPDRYARKSWRWLLARVGPDSPLDPYLPDESWFARNPRGIHGIAHATRVMFWADVLAASYRRPLMLDELRWASACHDVGRVNDGRDHGHGARSGEWVLANLASERPESAACDLEVVALLCRCHNASARGLNVPRLELQILRDADGLDRARFRGGGRLRPEALGLRESHALIGPNQRLFDRAGHDATAREIVAVGEWIIRRSVPPDLLRGVRENRA